MDDDPAAATPSLPMRRGTVAVGAGVAAGLFLAGAALVALQWQLDPPDLRPDAPLARLLRLATLAGGTPVLGAALVSGLFGALGGSLAAQRRSPMHGALAGLAAFVLVAVGLFLIAVLPAALVDGPGGTRRLLDEVLVLGACIGLPAAIGGAVAGWWTREGTQR
jgi:hypothetical protein